MPQERDPSGRFVKTPSDGAESGPEPEAEPEGPGSLAQLLAAFGEQLRGLEERQNAARDGDRAALQAELANTWHCFTLPNEQYRHISLYMSWAMYADQRGCLNVLRI